VLIFQATLAYKYEYNNCYMSKVYRNLSFISRNSFLFVNHMQKSFNHFCISGVYYISDEGLLNKIESIFMFSWSVVKMIPSLVKVSIKHIQTGRSQTDTG